MPPHKIGFGGTPANIDTSTNANDERRIFKASRRGLSTDTLSEGDENAAMSPSEADDYGESMPLTATSMSANAKSLLSSINASKPSNSSTND